MNSARLEQHEQEGKSPTFLFTHVGIMYSTKCNIRCDHCMVEAGPECSERLADGQVEEVITSLSQLGIGLWGITGGEPFLFPAKIRRFLSWANDSEIKSMIATNAFWARTYEDARQTLQPLRQAGLSKLLISASKFHQVFIDVQCVVNAAQAACDDGIDTEVHLTMTREMDGLTRHLLRTLRQNRISVRPYRLSLAGRASRLAHEVMTSHGPSSPPGGCDQIHHPIVMTDGRVVSCCSLPTAPDYAPPSWSPLLLGNINERSLADILTEANQSVPLRLLARIGPEGILNLLQGSAFAGEYPTGTPDESDRCKLCYHLFSQRNAREHIELLAGNWRFV